MEACLIGSSELKMKEEFMTAVVTLSRVEWERHENKIGAHGVPAESQTPAFTPGIITSVALQSLSSSTNELTVQS